MAIKRRRVKAVIQFRRATESEWISKDPILRNGEPALSTNLNRFKIGDGSSKWSELPYQTSYSSTEGTTDYNLLFNLPYINGIKLKGALTSEELGIDYIAGSGIIIENREIGLDNLILDCGTSTTNI